MKQTFYLLLIAVASLTIAACGSNANDEGSDSTKKSEEVEGSEMVAGQETVEEGEAPYELTKEVALPRIWSFQEGNPEPGASNPTMIEIPDNAFEILANNVEPEGAYAVFAKTGDELEIIFVGKDKGGSGNWRYFNFTQPCPPICKKDTTRISTDN